MENVPTIGTRVNSYDYAGDSNKKIQIIGKIDII